MIRADDELLDLPPEYCHYQDEGCEFSNSCLNCTLPVCIHELPGGRRHWLKSERNRKIARQYGVEGKPVSELAAAYGVSQRTIQRALRAYPPDRGSRNHEKHKEE